MGFIFRKFRKAGRKGAKKNAVTVRHGKKSISKAALQPLFRPVEGAADGAFVDPLFVRNFLQGHLPEIVGKKGFSLVLGQFFVDNLFYPA